jgi:serine/threonine protein kinase
MISGSLDHLLFEKHSQMTEEQILRVVRGIASGMCHLHKHNIVHRDLAARNILLTATGVPKISVFLFFPLFSLILSLKFRISLQTWLNLLFLCFVYLFD